MREEDYSPYAIIQKFEEKGWPSKTRICEKTIYSYIGAGVISGITEKDLLLGGRRRKPRERPARHSRAENAARSIDKRPQQINDRSEIGHWEMDTVYSGKGCSKECLLTITERLARLEISRKIPDRTAASVKRELDKLEKQMGCIPFQMLFKSLTADNGVEFSGAGDLEGSSLCNGQRTQLYFAHPYCSSERGTNENHNGIIRRFIPKGSDIGLTGEQDVKEIQDWMNTYPRKILGGKTPLGRLKAEMGEGFTIPSFLEPTPR